MSEREIEAMVREIEALEARGLWARETGAWAAEALVLDEYGAIGGHVVA